MGWLLRIRERGIGKVQCAFGQKFIKHLKDVPYSGRKQKAKQLLSWSSSLPDRARSHIE